MLECEKVDKIGSYQVYHPGSLSKKASITRKLRTALMRGDPTWGYKQPSKLAK